MVSEPGCYLPRSGGINYPRIYPRNLLEMLHFTHVHTDRVDGRSEGEPLSTLHEERRDERDVRIMEETTVSELSAIHNSSELQLSAKLLATDYYELWSGDARQQGMAGQDTRQTVRVSDNEETDRPNTLQSITPSICQYSPLCN